VAEIAARLASNDAMIYKGAIDASTNPNYPAANAGDTYRISVAGKIGGASGPNVEAGDIIICHVDASGSGTQAGVGANWDIIQTNIDGAATADNSLTFTNKTINLSSNTLTGTLAQFNTACSDADFASLAGSENLTNKTLTTPTIASFTNATHNHQDAAGGGTLAEAALALTDITTNNVTSTKHGFAPKSPADATQFLNGAATPAFAAVKDSDLSTSDVTTNNATTAKHGFLKKLSNVGSEYMDGTGNWSVPSGSVLRYSADVGDNSSTSIVVTHSLGTRDLTVKVYDKTTPYQVVEPDVYMTSTTTVTLTFSVAPTTNQYRVVIVG
jgi:hypothetical protein